MPVWARRRVRVVRPGQAGPSSGSGSGSSDRLGPGSSSSPSFSASGFVSLLSSVPGWSSGAAPAPGRHVVQPGNRLPGAFGSSSGQGLSSDRPTIFPGTDHHLAHPHTARSRLIHHPTHNYWLLTIAYRTTHRQDHPPLVAPRFAPSTLSSRFDPPVVLVLQSSSVPVPVQPGPASCQLASRQHLTFGLSASTHLTSRPGPPAPFAPAAVPALLSSCFIFFFFHQAAVQRSMLLFIFCPLSIFFLCRLRPSSSCCCPAAAGLPVQALISTSCQFILRRQPHILLAAVFFVHLLFLSFFIGSGRVVVRPRRARLAGSGPGLSSSGLSSGTGRQDLSGLSGQTSGPSGFRPVRSSSGRQVGRLCQPFFFCQLAWARPARPASSGARSPRRALPSVRRPPRARPVRRPPSRRLALMVGPGRARARSGRPGQEPASAALPTGSSQRQPLVQLALFAAPSTVVS